MVGDVCRCSLDSLSQWLSGPAAIDVITGVGLGRTTAFEAETIEPNVCPVTHLLRSAAMLVLCYMTGTRVRHIIHISQGIITRPRRSGCEDHAPRNLIRTVLLYISTFAMIQVCIYYYVVNNVKSLGQEGWVFTYSN